MKHVFFLDGQEIPFTPGQNVLEAAIAAGKDQQIPYFCFHPALGVVLQPTAQWGHTEGPCCKSQTLT